MTRPFRPMRKLDVPYIGQSPRWPTGCESVSTVMLLQYLGYDLSVDGFIERYLDRRDFERREGELYGPDPRRAFAGSPYDPDSFGCYAPVIAAALRRIVSDRFDVKDETGKEISALLPAYIDRGMPVILWACIELRPSIVGPSWRLLESGETFTWRSNEHCMLLVGYDAASYFFNDPYENHGCVAYPRALVEQRHREQGMQAIGLIRRQA